MEKISGKAKVNIEFTINLTLTVDEAEALRCIACYGSEAFLKAFYTVLGKEYLLPYEQNVKELFNRIEEKLPIEILKCKKADKSIKQALVDFK